MCNADNSSPSVRSGVSVSTTINTPDEGVPEVSNSPKVGNLPITLEMLLVSIQTTMTISAAIIPSGTIRRHCLA